MCEFSNLVTYSYSITDIVLFWQGRAVVRVYMRVCVMMCCIVMCVLLTLLCETDILILEEAA